MKRELGAVGVWSEAVGLLDAARARAAIAEIEGLGYRALWYPEPVVGKEALTHGALLLAWSARIVVASAIVNLWARDPIAAANAGRALSDAYPGRFLLGIGASNEVSVPMRGRRFERPLSRMRDYLDAMDRAPYAAPEPAGGVRRFLAALGPRMLALAGERTIGAHPYFVPVDHTAFAREILGPEPLLAVAQPVVLTDDRATVRDRTAAHMQFYLERKPYRDNLKRFGWSADDLEGSGSAALVDAIVASPDPESVRARVRSHFDAGADHVCIQPIGPKPDDPQLQTLRRLAPLLLED